MNVVLWCVQWALAVVFLFSACVRLQDSLARYRRGSVLTGKPLFTRGEGFTAGVVMLVGAAALVSPVLDVLHARWVVPAAAVVLLVTTVVLDRVFHYGGGTTWVFGFLLVALAVLRAWPYPFYA
ncbi:hypothetical protein [Amycolatopsis sp. NPDC050768]|uniref:hypothetical protein n=1 Tax=Amycolatopsis sp. NPDC050768 TaxID=3154839 RepID=UPI00340A84EE